MFTNLQKAIDLLTESLPKMERLEKELEQAKAELVRVRELLQKEKADNLELRGQILKLQTHNSKQLRSSGGEIETVKALVKQSAGSENPDSVSEVVSDDVFTIKTLGLKHQDVMLRTKHIHKFLFSKLDIREPKLRLWLDDAQIVLFEEAKSALLQSVQSNVQAEQDLPIVDSKEENKAEIVTGTTLLKNIEIPTHLANIVKLTLETFGEGVSVRQVMRFGEKERIEYKQPVSMSLKALVSHLKKRVKGKSSVKLTQDSLELENRLGQLSTYTTMKGKELRGWFIGSLTKEQAFTIDPYTFERDGKYFIREKHGDVLWKQLSLNGGEKDSTSLSLNAAVPVHELSRHDKRLISSLEFNGVNVNFTQSTLLANELFRFNNTGYLNIEVNLEHKFIQSLSDSVSIEFWRSFQSFIALWGIAKQSGISDIAKDNSILSRGYFMKSLHEYVKSEKKYKYSFSSLPQHKLFDYEFRNNELELLVNKEHPFNAVYLSRLTAYEEQAFIDLYIAWIISEINNLSEKAQSALLITREFLGSYYYDVVEEMLEASEALH
ncbi:hypothetical protein [Vibrio maritimus]|uniref:hypothetical protein n=1 Tax=Vibrio maritimus TaxID=990268 RepID=UPI001F2C2701|nr:hypothetical protein [Vibrio maritimus]